MLKLCTSDQHGVDMSALTYSWSQLPFTVDSGASQNQEWVAVPEVRAIAPSADQFCSQHLLRRYSEQ